MNPLSDIRTKSVSTDKFTTHLSLPLKIAGCIEWIPNAKSTYKIILNHVYLGFVLFVLSNLQLTLIVNIITEWTVVMESLEKIADSIPIVLTIAITVYFAFNRENYVLHRYMNDNFRYRSAQGLTNMDMSGACTTARRFACIYTACTLFSVTMYTVLPMIMHLWTKAPLDDWFYMDVSSSPYTTLMFLRQCIGQAIVGLSVGQLGVYFACNCILICGQLDLLCCSIRNARYTALLRHGIKYEVLLRERQDIMLDEKHNYTQNTSEAKESMYHYDDILKRRVGEWKLQFDIYSSEYDEATLAAFTECAQVAQVIAAYKDKFEKFLSPLLALRVIQVTLYLCVLLYAASKKLETVTIEYLLAVALDMFLYCYYGNQIIIQSDRVSTAAYQSAWHTMGAKPRRVLLNILLAHQRPLKLRAGKFLAVDLQSYLLIIKTSFSYYTLLVNVNEK